MSLDSPAVHAVAEALAKADWTGGDPGREWTWRVLPSSERMELVWSQIPAARVAVAAVEQAAA